MFIYIYVYIYICVCIYIYMYICAPDHATLRCNATGFWFCKRCYDSNVQDKVTVAIWIELLEQPRHVASTNWTQCHGAMSRVRDIPRSQGTIIHPQCQYQLSLTGFCLVSPARKHLCISGGKFTIDMYIPVEKCSYQFECFYDILGFRYQLSSALHSIDGDWWLARSSVMWIWSVGCLVHPGVQRYSHL